MSSLSGTPPPPRPLPSLLSKVLSRKVTSSSSAKTRPKESSSVASSTTLPPPPEINKNKTSLTHHSNTNTNSKPRPSSSSSTSSSIPFKTTVVKSQREKNKESSTKRWFTVQCTDVINRRVQSEDRDGFIIDKEYLEVDKYGFKDDKKRGEILGEGKVSDRWGEVISIQTSVDVKSYNPSSIQSLPSSSSSEKKNIQLSRSANNPSLQKIFFFYAKLSKASVQRSTSNLTFGEIQIANTTLSPFECLCFLIDFKIIPTLLTKREFLSIWKWCKARRGRRALSNTSDSTEGKELGELGKFFC